MSEKSLVNAQNAPAGQFLLADFGERLKFTSGISETARTRAHSNQ